MSSQMTVAQVDVDCLGRTGGEASCGERWSIKRLYDTIVWMGTEETKSALLAAARRLIGERGYASTSVRELAAAAGTNIAAVNYHFGSRENLLNEAMLEFFKEWAGRSAEVDVDPKAEPLEQLAERSRPMVDGIAAAQPAFVMALEALLQARRSPELHDRIAEHYAELRRIAMQSMAETERGRELPPRFLEIAASYLIAVADGLQLQALLDPAAIPTADELAFFYESLAAGARAAAEPTGGSEREADGDAQ
jgi:AcrR family transcriptional regulator